MRAPCACSPSTSSRESGAAPLWKKVSARPPSGSPGRLSWSGWRSRRSRSAALGDADCRGAWFAPQVLRARRGARGRRCARRPHVAGTPALGGWPWEIVRCALAQPRGHGERVQRPQTRRPAECRVQSAEQRPQTCSGRRRVAAADVQRPQTCRRVFRRTALRLLLGRAVRQDP